jgi:hypothetical protein
VLLSLGWRLTVAAAAMFVLLSRPHEV